MLNRHMANTLKYTEKLGMDRKRILIVAATDLSDDNSASLCHSAYIRGFVQSGHDVRVLTVSPLSHRHKHEVDGVEYIYISDENFLVRNIRERRKNISIVSQKQNNVVETEVQSLKQQIKKVVKEVAVCLFGATTTWNKRACKFKSDEKLDLVLSLSSPPTSHSVAYKLLKRRRIKSIEWCQLWEDPWSTDLYKVDPTVYKKEKRLLDKASKVLYVTPMTLERQRKLFASNAEKMDWLPLPTYFSESISLGEENGFTFGYFGQYFPQVRNLAPVYNALNRMKQKFIICGEPRDLFQETLTTEIYPRVTPDELKKFEDQTNVLVFVANLGGGQIPGKIYQYSGTDKWILFVLDGTEQEKCVLKEYFGKFNRYAFCDNTEESIMENVTKILNGTLHDVTNKKVDYFEAGNIANEILLRVL